MRLKHKIKSTLWTLSKINIYKTIYFNFKVLPFNSAIKFPFLLYGKVVFGKLDGNIVLPNTLAPGMIRIGYRWIDLWPMSFLPTQFQVLGTIVFKGETIISGGANINVQSKEGELTIGDKTVIGGGSVVKCLENIEIGDETGITGNCNIMDCNMHFVKNIDTGVVANYKAPIKIGKSCWINYGTVVSKGAVIPDYTITSRNALISKDYSELGTNLFLVGAPAKPTPSKVQRIFSIEKQREYVEFFKNGKNNILQLEPGIEEELGHREGFK